MLFLPIYVCVNLSGSSVFIFVDFGSREREGIPLMIEEGTESLWIPT